MVIKSARQFQRAVECAHPTRGRDPGRKHNALFMGKELNAARVVASLPPLREDLDELSFGPGAIFWSASRARITATTMMKIGQLAIYQHLTVRNHKTTWKLLELLNA